MLDEGGFPPDLDRDLDLRLELLRPIDDPVQLAIVQGIGAAVARERGLPVPMEIGLYLISRDDLAEYFASTRSEADHYELDVQARAWRLLRYIRPGDDILTLTDELYEGSVIAFYGDGLGLVVVVSDEAAIRAGDVPSVAHELAHAVQDELVDLGATYEAFRGNSDMRLAYTLLIEGDARSMEGRIGSLAPWMSQLAAGTDRGSIIGLDLPGSLVREFNTP